VLSFCLLGDLFKVVVDATKGIATVKYFDTVPVATQLCITLRGLLFVAAEVGDHELYQFKSVGDDPDDDGVVAQSGDSLKVVFISDQQRAYASSFLA